MFPTPEGGAVADADAPNKKIERRDFDRTAQGDAIVRAEAECLALLAVLHNAGKKLPGVAAQARETMRAAGMLWETTSRLLDE